MQRRTKGRHSKKKRLLLLVLIAILLIVLIKVIFIPLLAKKTLYINPVTKTSNQDAKKIETLLIDAQIAFASITLEADSSYVVKLVDGVEVVLSLKKDLERQITSLQPILKQLTIDGRKFNRIDFRYDKPLVVYE